MYVIDIMRIKNSINVYKFNSLSAYGFNFFTNLHESRPTVQLRVIYLHTVCYILNSIAN